MIAHIDLSPKELNELDTFYNNLLESDKDSSIASIIGKVLSSCYDSSIIKEKYLRERDKAIFFMRNKGMSLNDIGTIYSISRERVRQIYNKERAKQEELKMRGDGFTEDDYSNFYNCLLVVGVKYGYSDSLITRSYNCLVNAKIIACMKETNISLDAYSDKELLDIRHFGASSLHLCRMANDLYKTHLSTKRAI